jgi:hypothetical protein
MQKLPDIVQQNLPEAHRAYVLIAEGKLLEGLAALEAPINNVADFVAEKDHENVAANIMLANMLAERGKVRQTLGKAAMAAQDYVTALAAYSMVLGSVAPASPHEVLSRVERLCAQSVELGKELVGKSMWVTPTNLYYAVMTMPDVSAAVRAAAKTHSAWLLYLLERRN